MDLEKSAELAEYLAGNILGTHLYNIKLLDKSIQENPNSEKSRSDELELRREKSAYEVIFFLAKDAGIEFPELIKEYEGIIQKYKIGEIGAKS